MRKFGKDKPEFMAFQLGDAKKVYKLPLAASLPIETLRAMNKVSAKGAAEQFDFQVEFLRKYIGDSVDKLTAGDVREILTAWSEESFGQGAGPGE